MGSEIYLDNSSTTRQYDEVTSLMATIASTKYGNPSSLHTKGIEAERLVSASRETIADLLGVRPSEVYFTSGGTESNNLAIIGYLEANPRKGRHIITTSIEHPSVLEVFRHLGSRGWSVDFLDVDEKGRILTGQLEEKIRPDTALISIVLVNNETGTIQDIEEISSIRDSLNPQTVIHADAVQAFGKITLYPVRAGIDLMSVSSHKIHGPKGVGALYVSAKVRINPLFYGGGQETLLRSGTENVPGIAGFGLAASMTTEKIDESFRKAVGLRELLISELASSDISYCVNSPDDALPHIVNISFENVRAEVLLHHLEQRGIFVSTGSACSSHKKSRSHVLTAMGIAPELIDGAIRFSFSNQNTEDEIRLTVDALKDIIPVIDISRKKRPGRK
ncbi:MAG: cysteine desulfurase family protein [Acetivibrionales bacterium]|jgi:cysteine desulfurase|nr:cysteine desulfurase family protein [Bacillota bacterium]NLP07463.1 cysteine desulfurase [Clostridiaceae bacterium]HQD31836.1 cysteine desulfurase family protein [Clostridiales bacterium]